MGAVPRLRRGTDPVEEPAVDVLPGFRRRILIQPVTGRVTVELEDDYHRMSVIVAHDEGVAVAVTGAMARAPWTTCPGAEAELSRSFVGRRLADFAVVGERERNCTHLHDLALLAAAHAGDAEPTVIDVLVSDAVDGIKRAELRRGGVAAMRWRLAGNRIAEPVEVAGRGLLELGDWIAGLDPSDREAARLLRWSTMMSGGRMIVVEKDTKELPQGKCYTFQPDRFALASRLGEFRELSGSGGGPLADRLTGSPGGREQAA